MARRPGTVRVAVSLAATPTDRSNLAVWISTNVTVLAALLYYFGWVRTQATCDYFGIDAGALGLSAADYMLRSLNSVFRPLIVVVLALFVLHVAHRSPVPAAGRVSARFVTRIRWSVETIAVLVLLIAAAGAVWYGTFGWHFGLALPVGMATAAAVLTYLRRSGGRLLTSLLVTFTVVGTLWAVAFYAVALGRQTAADIVAGSPYAPEVLLYSTERQAIAGTGVTVDELPPDGSRYRFRYAGLRMLAQDDEHLVLLPAGWRKGYDSVFFVPEGENVRYDIVTTT